ncbi:hypothetical protein R3P38DRAFT_2849269 [Favolaschia claudopus]|uniref:Uncharacterized protein n=1 Tax=Favolaschia claudopus TaxID=2862362 RepID=A0AAW0DW03_9AGAR
MDPLKPYALAAVEDWNAFEPDAKGYIPPQELQLWPGCISIEDQLRKLTKPSLFHGRHNLSGSLSPLRDALCLWKHKLLADQDAPPLLMFFLAYHPKHAQEFRDKDAALLCHIAPLAKAYGFNLNLARLNFIRSTRKEVQHEYKDYLGLHSEYDGEDLTMSNHPRESYSLGELTDLGGERLKNDALLKLAIEQVKRPDSYFRELFHRLRYIERHEIEDDGCYFAKVNYEHIYTVRVLLLVAT